MSKLHNINSVARHQVYVADCHHAQLSLVVESGVQSVSFTAALPSPTVPSNVLLADMAGRFIEFDRETNREISRYATHMRVYILAHVVK